MLTAQLRTAGKTIQRLSLPALSKRLHSHNLRRAIGQRARLVESDVAHIRETLERIALARQKTMLRHIANRRHDRRRRRQNQRTRTEHNENRHRTDDLTCKNPGEQRRRQRDHNDPRRPAISKIDDLRLAGVNRLHKPDHALDGAVFANLRRTHVKCAELIHRPRRYVVADALVHRQRFPSHHRLIDRRLTARDHAIHRHRFARQHTQ